MTVTPRSPAARASLLLAGRTSVLVVARASLLLAGRTSVLVVARASLLLAGRASVLSGTRASLLLIACGLSALGCSPTMSQLRSTASADFGCPVEAVEVATVDSDTMYAACYEQEATYTGTCKGDEGCRWIKDATLDPGATRENN